MVGTPGDILAIRGRGFFARGILKATGNTVSHVGMVIGDDPDIVIEALLRVKTRPLAESIADADRAYLLHDLSLSAVQREIIVSRGCSFSAESYNFGDIGLQLADSVFRTRWFTEHLSLGLQEQPICSFLVAASYRSVGLNFGVDDRSCTPADIFKFAIEHPAKYHIICIK